MKRIIATLISIAIIMSAWIATYIHINTPTNESEADRYIALAEKQSAAGAYGSAIRLYQRAVSIEDSAELRLKLAEFWGLYGNEARFRNELKDLIRAYPKELQAYELLAEDYYNESEFSKCCNVVDNARAAGVQSKLLDEIYYNSAYRYKILPNEYESAGVFFGGYAAVKSKGKTYIVNNNLKPICDTGFDSADVFFGSSAAVSKDGSQYFIDENGEKYMVTESACSQLYSYSDGRAAVKWDEKYGYIDIFGERVFGEYEFASTYSCGYAAVCDEHGWYLIDTEGKPFTDARYDDIKLDENNTVGGGGFCFFKENGFYYILDMRSGKTGKTKFEDVRAPADDNLAAVKQSGMWGYADRDGSIRIMPVFEDATAFSCGLAAVKQGGTWGYIDSEGRTVIDFKFEGANRFSDNGMAPVLLDGKWRYIKLEYRENLK